MDSLFGAIGNGLTAVGAWQAAVCAFVCGALTEAIKRQLDLRLGREARKADERITYWLWLSPMIIGVLYALVVPLHPPAILDYLDAQKLSTPARSVGLAAWGFACGAFGNFAYLFAEEQKRRKLGKGGGS